MTSSLAAGPEMRRWSDELSPSLIIRLSRGTGTGLTRLAAFDQALQSAGVADFNLVRLSSIIPPGAIVLDTPASEQIQGGHGDLLYCVYADAYATLPGQSAWAGVIWARHEDGSGAGLFAEHGGPSQQSVERDLHATMEAMTLSRRPGFRSDGMMLSSVTCQSQPVCALVIASYQASSWDRIGRS